MSEEQPILIKIKLTSNNLNFDVKLLPSQTILDLKKACAEQAKLTEKEQNLVFKGRILQDDKLISDYQIQNDHTIILVKKMTAEKKGKLPHNKETSSSTSSTSNTTSTNNQQSSGQTGQSTSQNTNQNFNNPFGGGFGGMGNLGGMGFGQGMGGLGGFGGMDQNTMMNMMSNPQYQQMMSQVKQI